MKISRVLAGFTAGEADFLRKAMGKKKHDVLAKMYNSFVSGCVENGVSKKIANKIWKDWEGFADYAFNKSHAACYAMIAYRTAYLKARYPSAFMAAVMNSDAGSIDRITIEVEECERMGHKVLPPDVNESFPGFAVVKETGYIRWGLSAIKNFGEESARLLVLERKENGPYLDVADFASRLDTKALNKKSLEALVKSGALDRFDDRGKLIANIEQILLFNKQARKDKEQNQISMFDLAPDMSESTLALSNTMEISKSQMLSWEKELLGIYVSDHPARLFFDQIDTCVTAAEDLTKRQEDEIVTVIGVISDVKRILTKKKQEPMAFVRIEDVTGSTEMVVFPRTYSKIRTFLEPDTLVVVQGKVSIRERNEETEWSVLVDKFIPFKEKDIPRLVHMLKTTTWYEDGFEEDEEEEDLSDYGVSVEVPAKPSHEMITALREVFKASPGHEPVYLVVDSGGKQRKVATEYSIEKSDNVLKRIKDIVGHSKVY
jgi:DNA polymerase-3 subunit alpha